MLSPLPMKHVLLQVLTEDLPQASLILADLEVYSPDFRALQDDRFPNVPGENFRHLYNQAQSRLTKIARHVPLSEAIQLNQLHVISEEELSRTNDWLGTVWERCSEFEERFHRLRGQEAMINELQDALDNFAELNIDLGLLQGDRMFLDIHIGTVPRANVTQLREAIKLAGYLLYCYREEENNAHVVVVGPRGGRESDLRLVLFEASAGVWSDIPQGFEVDAARDVVRGWQASHVSQVYAVVTGTAGEGSSWGAIKAHWGR